MNGIEQAILFALGCISLVVGMGLMAWSAIQKKAVAGPRGQSTAGAIEALAKLVDALGRYIGDYAGRVGWLLVIVGIGLIFGPFFLPAH